MIRLPYCIAHPKRFAARVRGGYDLWCITNVGRREGLRRAWRTAVRIWRHG